LLDCAAGTGEITCALLNSGRFDHATIVDVSPAMLQCAKELLTSQIKNAEVEFVQSDVFNFIRYAFRSYSLPGIDCARWTTGHSAAAFEIAAHAGRANHFVGNTDRSSRHTHYPRGQFADVNSLNVDIEFPGSPNETSPTRATAPGCEFWRRGGTAWVFHSAIACGRGRIFSWKRVWKNGRAAPEPTPFICSDQHESRFFGQQRFRRSRRTVSKRARTCQGGSVY
jgi:hypothetical protein